MLQRCRHICNQQIQKALDSLAQLKCGRAYRNDDTFRNALHHAPADLIIGEFFPFEVFLHEFVIRAGDGFLQVIVNLRTQRPAQRHQCGAEGLLQFVEGLIKIKLILIPLIDYNEARGVIPLADLPGLLGSHLNARTCVDHNHRRIGSSERCIHFSHEIRISRCVNEVNLVILPFDRNDGCIDGKSLLHLHLVIVGYSVSILDLTQLLDDSRLIKRSFQESGFPAPAVTQQGDVSNGFARIAFHIRPPRTYYSAELPPFQSTKIF